MYVERLLQINIAVLVCLATLLIGVGQHDAALPLVMFFVAIASLWLNDYTKWIAMNRTITGAGQVAAMVFAMASLEWDRNSLILALGQVLVYWQFIILFQKKDANLLAPGPTEPAPGGRGGTLDAGIRLRSAVDRLSVGRS